MSNLRYITTPISCTFWDVSDFLKSLVMCDSQFELQVALVALAIKDPLSVIPYSNEQSHCGFHLSRPFRAISHRKAPSHPFCLVLRGVAEIWFTKLGFGGAFCQAFPSGPRTLTKLKFSGDWPQSGPSRRVLSVFRHAILDLSIASQSQKP